MLLCCDGTQRHSETDKCLQFWEQRPVVGRQRGLCSASSGHQGPTPATPGHVTPATVGHVTSCTATALVFLAAVIDQFVVFIFGLNHMFIADD